MANLACLRSSAVFLAQRLGPVPLGHGVVLRDTTSWPS